MYVCMYVCMYVLPSVCLRILYKYVLPSVCLRILYNFINNAKLLRKYTSASHRILTPGNDDKRPVETISSGKNVYISKNRLNEGNALDVPL